MSPDAIVLLLPDGRMVQLKRRLAPWHLSVNRTRIQSLTVQFCHPLAKSSSLRFYNLVSLGWRRGLKGFECMDFLRKSCTVVLETGHPITVSLRTNFLVDWSLLTIDFEMTILATRLTELFLLRPILFS